MNNGKLVPVYYIYDKEDNSISISGKEYVDVMDCYADGANGENGIVDSDKASYEPYNYFSEINEAMWSLNHPENYEGNFDMDGCTLKQVIAEMRAKGFEMICDSDEKDKGEVEMGRFLNDDVKLRYGGRKGIKMSIDELRTKLWEFIQNLDDAEDNFDLNDMSDDDIAGLIAIDDEKLQKDIKFANYCENIIANDSYHAVSYEGQSLLGFHTLENGFTFYGAMGGADWAWPMFSIFYYDGNRIRAYTPIRGNTVNTDFKSALGLEGEYYEVDEDKVIKKYQKLGIYNPPANPGNIGTQIFGRGLEDESWEEMYLKKYELDDAFLNFNAMKEEIMARITLV